MMEKEMNKQQLDKLIKDWTDELLAPHIDDKITDSLMDFVEDEDTETDVSDLIDFHIHQLAIEENTTRLRKWRIFVSSVAAASVVVLIVAAILLSTYRIDSHIDTKTLIVEKKVDDNPNINNKEKPENIADSTNMILAKAMIKGHTEVACGTKRERNYAGKAKKQQESSTEQNLIEAITEINVGIGNMVENTKECMKMTNVSLLPENLFSDINECDSFEATTDDYSSTQHYEQIQKLNIIETNLINTLYEIRNLNIDLNFKTDNKKTEI